MPNSQYPESDKLSAIATERSGIIEFCDWLADQGIQLCSVPPAYEHTYHPISRTTDSLIYEMYGVDPIALEKERRAMLAALANANDFND